ncbi:MAG: argininosuccinate synthase [Atribacterota bacterium]|nr:argininosuccinate synthase [Atribacterota bacterium]MDD4896044.1 argininosuccinate synthase [Atribacterota bacterium]MDD5637303.1 argininosuccinate synthase [Atribacterota bacterium]
MNKLKKVILAYSGGLDTSIAIRWLKENYCDEVIAVTIDVGQEIDLEFVKEKALKVGASKSYIVDAREEFARDYVLLGLQAGAVYEEHYPLATAYSRPLIAKILVDLAEKEQAQAIAHGCTGKGNDQVRFEVSTATLNPDLEVIAPAREWGFTREEEIQYARQYDIPIPVDVDNPYSVDQNIWGRSCECGILEDPWIEPPEEAYEWTVKPEDAVNKPVYLEIYLERGVPIQVNGQEKPLVQLISYLNKVGGENAIGRVDMVENRLVGIKSREIYECPGAIILLNAYKALESMVFTRDLLHFKQIISQKYAELTYNGLWFSPLKEALDGFIGIIKDKVTGTVRVKLLKGRCEVAGRKSVNSLYDFNLATYDQGDTFNQDFAKGFIQLWGLPSKVYASVNRKSK